jgi:hypothetical protein
MFSIKLKALSLLLFAGLTAVVCGQAQSQPAAAATDNYVTNTGFKNKVFEVRNRPPKDLEQVIRLLTSGFKGAQLSASDEFRTITVRDFPENIAAIEEALKRLDTPEPARPSLEIRMHVLLASNAEGKPSQYPADLKEVIAELQKTLNYKEYSLLTSIVQRTRESRGFHPGHLEGKGSAEVISPAGGGNSDRRMNSYYQFSANSIAFLPGPSGVGEIEMGDFTFSLAMAGTDSKIRSDVRMRDGEKVVVGTAGFQDKGMILVMTARVLK